MRDGNCEENRYEEEKHTLAGAVIEALTAHIPEIKGRGEVWNIATPLTLNGTAETGKAPG